MNPKFKELALQAGAYKDGDTLLTGPMDVGGFAEAIVKECCGVLLKCKSEPFPFDEDYACRLLKTHFGVE